MPSWEFDNRFLRELPGDAESHNVPRPVAGACWSPVLPTPVAAPRLFAYSREMAACLDLDAETIASPAMVEALAGNRRLPGMETYATCYGGHQFGHWAGQLGDGRVIFLGEVVNRAGQRWELQLKGAGPTPYSRRADGRAVLRSSIREFLCSEAMHHLGVPTTRALSLVGSGESVLRDMFYNGNPKAEPGAIVCRVAPSFTRFGHFELPARRGDHALLARLVAFTIARDFPELETAPEQRLAAWFGEICARTARMIAHWMRVGFVHGVMNTDNMSVLGLTIDYGPYGWVDNFDPDWTPNTTDASGRRYCYGRQPEIARWNLSKLAQALAILASDQQGLEAGLELYDQTYNTETGRIFAGKFGLRAWGEEDEGLIGEAFDLMQHAEVDMTEFFRLLARIDIDTPDPQILRPAFYREDLYERYLEPFGHWLAHYAGRLRRDGEPSASRRVRMDRINPRYVLRNYLAQEAIDLAEQGDPGRIHELLEVLRRPYEEQPGCERFAALRPDWARHKAGCSMLSCSS
jgi:uncharacterized protein YdiU (UPF0061 family)